MSISLGSCLYIRYLILAEGRSALNGKLHVKHETESYLNVYDCIIEYLK